MGSQAHAGAVLSPSSSAAEPSGYPFSALLEVATVEFLSSLQLLAERARFLTAADGVGIALVERGRFIYRATAGDSPETGTFADKNKAPITRCLATAKPSMISIHTSQGQTVKAAVPITQNEEIVGFFELHASRLNFSDDDLLAVSGLAALVNTALDHMRAAESTHQHITEAAPLNKPESVAPVSWHAEPTAEPVQKSDTALALSSAPLTVHVCQACGFPISDSRQLCVECERKPDAPKPATPQLLTTENAPSWIETHGYTLASLLVTALVIAIIYWLR